MQLTPYDYLTLLGLLGVLGLIILLIRHLVLWYWKINRIEALLMEIRDELRHSGRDSSVR